MENTKSKRQISTNKTPARSSKRPSSARTGNTRSNTRPAKRTAPAGSRPHPKAAPQTAHPLASKRSTPKIRPSAEGLLRIIPLGGMREIGKNMTAIEFGDDLIVIDCGIAFPGEDMPGVDIILPDFSYLRQNAHKLRGLLLTHGHEDHIGAIAYFMREFDCPVFATPLTVKLMQSKLSDSERGGKVSAKKQDPRLNIIRTGERFRLACFTVEFIHVNHSIADAAAICLDTPAGRLIHSGDFKVDFTPVHGKPIDLGRFAELGNEGVLALMMESTNVERSGSTPSEKMVGDSFAEIFQGIRGRIFVATFSSNVFRLQQIITAAEAQNRHVVLLGRSMLNVFEAANTLGYIKAQSGTLIDVSEVEHYRKDEIVFIITGTQGEPMAALSRMAFSEHRQVNIEAGDTVLLSSSVIPGNEKPIYRMIDELFKRGANVIYESLAEIHVSGHAYREELRLLLDLVKPQYFIPCHGEYRHLFKNARLAIEQGLAADHTAILSNGDILEIGPDHFDLNGFTDAEAILVDGSVGTVDQNVLRERRLLADDGIVAISLLIDKRQRCLVGAAQIRILGVIFQDEQDKIERICQERIRRFIEEQKNAGDLVQILQQRRFFDYLRATLYEATNRKPMLTVAVHALP